ncbi:pentatricopeptide repeat-containing protein At1g31430-like [Coffea eugenioides]|uniref:pentatricopeptide repeat-containing protein At1g31430-like n=1 Tax=Coffea eugenioides TaxID=49369 RepID=UPI000F608779|nr:pentatricopeptide repeat-containing protein At1g31430-like [Coffea eugenioides]
MTCARPIFRLFTTHATTSKTDPIFKYPNFEEFIQEFHAHFIRTHRHTDSLSMSNIIKFYALSSETIRKAHFAFLQIEHPTLPIWNFMIRGFAQSDLPGEATPLFEKMRDRGLHGNNLTFIFLFKACSRVSDILTGKKAHGLALKLGFGSYLYVCNSLIHMYGSCDALDFSRKIFDEMPERDLVSWNSLICGYSQRNKFKEILVLYGAMQATNLAADSITLVKVLLACSRMGELDVADSAVKYIENSGIEIDVYLGNALIDMYGRRGFVDLARGVFDRMIEKDVVTWNTMIMGYSKAGNFDAAMKLFDEMPRRDVISWTSIIVGYCHAKQFSDAIRIFRRMMAAKVKPDEVTVASVLSACAHLGMLDVGNAVHKYVCEYDVKVDIHVGNALIDMYCKCGSTEKALEVFHDMKEKDTVSWNSVISGLAVNGISDYALDLFSQMLIEGVKVTHGTFAGVLLACAHGGLVDKGLDYFDSMGRVHGLVPEVKHYGCIVDLFCRSGNLERAYEFIQCTPVASEVVVWRILLGGCKLHGNVSLAEIASSKLIELDPHNGANYVLSSSAYASAERWNDATKMRELIDEDDLQKPLGWSTIEVDGLGPVDSQGKGPSESQNNPSPIKLSERKDFITSLPATYENG